VDLTRLAGKLPLRVEGLVRKWARAQEAELLVNWERGRKGHPLKAIEPLE
jgi:hypothetical protein